MTDEQITAPQLHAVAKYQAELTRRILSDIELRKLALDQACRVADKSTMTAEQMIDLSKAMHAFLVEGVTQIDARAPQAS